MSKNQSELESDSPKIRKIKVMESSHSNTSSEDEDSSEISVKITSRLNEIKKQSSALRNFQQQILELKRQNIELKAENAQLMEMIQHSQSDKILKKQLKQRQKQIQQLKRQISQSNYYESSRNSRPESAIRVDIEDRRYKLRSKSIKNKKKARESQSSEDDTESVQLRVFDHVSQLHKIKAEKLTLEKHFYELQQRLLILEHESKWMKNLAIKLINFAEKLSFVFKEQIFHQNWELLKKAKSSWRYLKHIVRYVLQIK